MIYYANDNTILDTEGFIYENQGKKARIYVKDGLVFKKFNVDTEPKYILKKKVFYKLKDIDAPNFIKLQKFYHQFEGVNQIFCMDGYTYDYIEKDGTVLLFQDKEYLLNIVNQLEKTITIFSKNKIKMYDCHGGNIIFNENNAILIDPDMFSKSHLSYRELLTNNKKELMHYIMSTLHNDMYDHYRSDYNKYNYDLDAYNFKINYKTDLAQELNNKIKVKSIYESIKKDNN